MTDALSVVVFVLLLIIMGECSVCSGLWVASKVVWLDKFVSDSAFLVTFER